MREREASARALARWRRRRGSTLGLGERGSEGRGGKRGRDRERHKEPKWRVL